MSNEMENSLEFMNESGKNGGEKREKIEKVPTWER